jgi:hypothetical protein
MTAATAPARTGRRLTNEQLDEVMELIKGSNSVELKVTVPTTAHRATVQGLPIDPVESQPRQVYFFDTPNLALYRAGVVVRARRIAGGRGDTVIKLRPVKPDELPASLRAEPLFNVEVDVLPGGFVCSASYKGTSDGDKIRAAVAGRKPISKLFSKGQRAFYAEHAPAGIDFDSLVPLGPTFVLKARFVAKMALDGAKPTKRSLVAEVWLYPDGSRILELSTKAPPATAVDAARECRAYFAERGVSLNAVQQTKTKTALEFYASGLDPAKPKAAPRAASKTTASRSAASKTAASKTAASKTAASKPATRRGSARKSAGKAQASGALTNGAAAAPS